MTTLVASPTHVTHPSAGGRLVATDGRELPLLSTRLTARARGGLARVVVEQRYRNVHAEPLTVTYLFPLPHDGAVSGYAFRLGERRIVGEVDRLESARERFEQALVEGRSAALLEQERGSLFTQSVGNVPPGLEVVVELTVDQRLAWASGDWEWRFPTAVAPRYLGAHGEVPDAARIGVDVADGTIAPRLHVSLSIQDPLPRGRTPASPSHAVRGAGEQGATQVVLADEGGAPLDRDLVVRWPVAGADVGVALDTFAPRDGRLAGRAFGLVTLVPPTAAGALRPIPRDLVVLLDTSGSMSGRPIDQAKAIVTSLVGSLGPDDSLELISFSDRPVRWRKGTAKADETTKTAARAWVKALEAGGSTEMEQGILEALRPLRGDAQRQVVLVTDGQIGAEQEVVAAVMRDLPPASRLHCVGVGEAVNRSLTAPVARAGRGLEVVVGIDESPAAAAGALVARTARPLVTSLRVEGSALAGREPERLADVFGEAPVLVPVELRPEGGEVVVLGETADGTFEQRVAVPAVAPGSGDPAIAALHAREAVEVLEMRLAAGEKRSTIDPAVEKLGLDFQISTRLTAWVAVSEEPTVDPGKPYRRERMPQQLPHGMSAEGLGLRSAAAGMTRVVSSMRPIEAYMATMDFCLADTRMPSPPRRPPTRDRLRLKARLAWVKDALVLTLEVAGRALSWEAPEEVVLVLSGGAPVPCKVDRLQSTTAGKVKAGQSARVVIPWREKGRPSIESVRIVVDGDERTVAVEGE